MSALKKFDSDWARFFLTIAFFCLLHFGDNRYVKKEEYSADMKSVRDSLVSLDKSIALLETTRRVQDDHETRLRALEARKISYEKKQTGSHPPYTLSLLPSGDLPFYAR